MTDLEYLQLQLDALVKSKANTIAQRALTSANNIKSDAATDVRIAELQAEIAALQNPTV